MERKRPGSRVSMSGDRVSPDARQSSNSVIAAPSGLKNSGIFNYSTGCYEVSINPDSRPKMSHSALQVLQPGTSRTMVNLSKQTRTFNQGSA